MSVSSRRLTIAALLFAALALTVWYEPGMIAGTPNDAPTAHHECLPRYALRGLGWEPWEIVEECW